MKVERMMPNICTENLADSRAFYTQLLGFEANFESDWFVQLLLPNGLELGLIDGKHDLVPTGFRGAPKGTYLTFVVDELGPILERVKTLNARVVSGPEKLFYGRERLLIEDPNGYLPDISAPY